MTQRIKYPTPTDLARHRADLRADTGALVLAAEVSNLAYAAAQLRKRIGDSNLNRQLGAHMLLAQVEASLRAAGAHITLAHQALTARGPYREVQP